MKDQTGLAYLKLACQALQSKKSSQSSFYISNHRLWKTISMTTQHNPAADKDHEMQLKALASTVNRTGVTCVILILY